MKPDPVDARLWETREEAAAEVLEMAEALLGPLSAQQREWVVHGAMADLEASAWRAGVLIGPPAGLARILDGE